VLVGPDEDTVFVHQAILSDSSLYFKNALKPEWNKDLHEDQVVLSGADTAIFRIYVNWLYTGHFNISNGADDRCSATPANPKTIDHEWTRWRQCYELANFLQDSDCKDALIDMAIEKMTSDEEYLEELPSLIYSTTHSQSPLRKLPVDIAVHVWTSHTIGAADKVDYPAEFLADVVKEMGRMLRFNCVSEKAVRIFFGSIHTCKYHEHTLTDSPCYKTKRGA
jgi:hypothetical protein